MPLKLDLPNARGLFITGTDTGVGKTLVAGGIARILMQRGLRVGVFKPIATGCHADRHGLVSADAEFLAWCADTSLPLSVINPVTYATPAAPVVCQEREHRAVDWEAVTLAWNTVCKGSDFVVVEGIGGVRVPVSRGVDILSLMRAMGLAAVVVARPNLGTINHTLLTVDAIRRAGIALAGLVLNGYDQPHATVAEETVSDVLSEWARTPLLAIVPRDPHSSVDPPRLGLAATEALARCDWTALGSAPLRRRPKCPGQQ